MCEVIYVLVFSADTDICIVTVLFLVGLSLKIKRLIRSLSE